MPLPSTTRYQLGRLCYVPLLSLVLVLLLLTPTARGQANSATVMANDARLAKFVELLDRAGISPSIALTIFAPTTDGFNTWRDQDVSLWNKYVSQPEFFIHLQQILLWHLVTEGAFTTDDIFDGTRGLLENTISNITVDQRFKKVDNVALTSFIDPNITTTEGFIHIINDVIIPPYMAVNLIPHMLERDLSIKFAYTTMANLALYAELDDKINALYEHGLTFLVPPNQRFNRAEVNVPKLLTPEMKNYTRDFVLAHLIMDCYYEAGIFAYNKENNQEQFLVKSELGTHLWITTTDNKLKFFSREVLVTDQVARNGIFHVLDLPLFPPTISYFVEFTSLSTNSSFDTSDCQRFFRQTLLFSDEIANIFDSTVTMFCPSQIAFAKFNNEDFQRLLEPIWKRHATEFLLNHFTIPAMTREELVNKAPTMITMLNGAQYELKRSGDIPRIKNTKDEQARSEFGDLIALDGYLHMIDTAITPTAVSRSVYDQTNLNPDFSILTENIDFVQMTDMIDRDIPLTFLTPNNQAWRRITFGTLDGANIIKRHLFTDKYVLFCDLIANRTQLVSVNNDTLPVELRGPPGSGLWGLQKQNLYVGGAYLYQCDVFARNGVLHYVDRVIGEDYETVSPTTSPAPTISSQPTVYSPPTAAPQEIPSDNEGVVPIVLPPILPGVLPSVQTDDAQTPAPVAESTASRTNAYQVTVLASLGLSWLLRVALS